MRLNRAVWEVGSTLVLVAAALTMTGVFLHDRAGASNRARGTIVEGWQAYNGWGIRQGPIDAQFVVTEFIDFTCGACRAFAPVIDSLLEMFPRQVAVVFQHFPLQGRELAIPSAVAVECAHEQNRFSGMYRSLINRTGSIDDGDWMRHAAQAGVADLRAFEDCITRPVDTFARIARGREIGALTNVRGTPTVWANGRVVAARTVKQFRDLAKENGVELQSN